MARKKEEIPQYGTTVRKGIQYYTTEIKDADGKRMHLYAKTPEELHEKKKIAIKEVEDAIFRRENPTVAEYAEKWLLMQSSKIQPSTLRGYRRVMMNYIVKPLGEMYMADVTTDDIRLAMVPVSKMSVGTFNTANMLIKAIFLSAEQNQLIDYNPAANVSAKGGVPTKEREALTDDQAHTLLEATKGHQSHTFVMIGLYAGLRREEILALKWECIHLDAPTPYLSVERAWRSTGGKADVSTVLKTKAARRDIPIPQCLIDCLRTEMSTSTSEYVFSGKEGQPLSGSQYQRLWNHVKVRTTKERVYYRYVNGQCIKKSVTPVLGEGPRNGLGIVYSIDFDVTPHMLRHTYITNLIHAGVDPKTVQYLAGHENSKMTMDIYAKVKYNKPEELLDVVNSAFRQGLKG